jgi:mannose-6-phosphate isomerase-like protein (cupin superfamily)
MSYTKNPEHSANILAEAIKSRRPTVFLKYYSNFPDKWEYFINFIDFAAGMPEPSKKESEEEEYTQEIFRKGMVAFWGHMTIMANKPTLGIFPGLKEIKSDLESVFKKDMAGDLAIINLSKIEKKLKRHTDERDHIYIQCVGSVTWRIYEDGSEEHVDHILGPGDMIFVPLETPHEVFSNSPRCSIIFGFDGNS